MKQPRDAPALLVRGRGSSFEAVQGLLQAAGHQVLIAETGDEVLQRLRDNSTIEIALIDAGTLEADGARIAHLLRADPQFHELPILFLAAEERVDDFWRLCFSLGAAGAIGWPAADDILLGRVQNFMNLHGKARQLSRQIAEKERAEARLVHLNAVLGAVRDINQLIVREKNRDRLLQGACQSLIDTRGYEGVWLLVWDEARRAQAYAEAGWDDSQGQDIEQIRARGPLACATGAVPGEVFRFGALPAGCEGCILGSRGCGRNGLSAPLEHDGRLLGRIALALPPDVQIDKDELALLDEVCDDLALALHSLNLEGARQEALERLHESREQYRDLYENAPNGYLSIDGHGRIERSNRRVAELLGYSGDELAGRPIVELYAASAGNEAPVAQALAAMQAGEVLRGQLLQMQRSDGRPIWVSQSVNALRDQNGRIVECRSVIVDVTERVRAENERMQLLREIQAQTRQLQQVIDTIPEGVILLDRAHRARLANPRGEQDLVLLAGVRIGDPVTQFGDQTLPDLLTSPPKGLWHEVAAGDRTFECIARPIENGATPQGWVLVTHEVTRERQLQQQVQQQERLAAIGQLAAGIAHDFNNIMAVIILQAQVGLKESSLSPATRERLETMNGQARRATDLIGQILDFSRSAVITQKAMDLLPLVKEQTRLLERTLPEHIEISLDYQPGEYLVNAEPTCMQQVLMNLAVNARGAMPDGGRLEIALNRISVARASEAPLPGMTAGDWIRIQVADEGHGIAADVLPHIFEPFFTTKPRGQGTGLGLAQVWGIVSQLGGDVGVTSEVGRGTRFSVYLPAILPGQSLAQAPDESRPSVTGNQERILLVEDNAAVRDALANALCSLGYCVLQASEGNEALRILDKCGADIALVLSDVVMPGMGGVALFHAIKERNLAVPMVVMTGHTMQREMDALLAEGLQAWIPKPPTIERIASVIGQALGK